MAAEPLIQITLVYSPQARVVREISMTVTHGTTVIQALLDSELSKDYPDLVTDITRVGIWGRAVDHAQTLREHDRIEIYRALTVDPKVARRERFTKQGSKGAGLFSKIRDGAKAGY